MICIQPEAKEDQLRRRTLPDGKRVTIVSSWSFINGRKGQVADFDAATNKYRVLIDGGKFVYVEPENLKEELAEEQSSVEVDGASRAELATFLPAARVASKNEDVERFTARIRERIAEVHGPPQNLWRALGEASDKNDTASVADLQAELERSGVDRGDALTLICALALRASGSENLKEDRTLAKSRISRADFVTALTPGRLGQDSFNTAKWRASELGNPQDWRHGSFIVNQPWTKVRHEVT